MKMLDLAPMEVKNPWVDIRLHFDFVIKQVLLQACGNCW